MQVLAVQNATQMPTTGLGASAAQRENGNATAITNLSVTCSAGAAAAVAGDIIVVVVGSVGWWAEVTGAAVAGVLPVKDWKAFGVTPTWTNTGRVDPVPANGTYRIFPATVLQWHNGFWKIKKVDILGVAAATLTINDAGNNVVLTIPAASTTPLLLDYGDGVPVKGPFTVVCSNHAVNAMIEFEAA